MDQLKEKLALIDALIKCLDIPREEVIKHWQTASMTNAPANEVFTKTDYPNIKPGMFWYEDDTFSFDKIKGKKIKAIVELVEDGFVYGDLMASDIFAAKAESLPWSLAKEYIRDYDYPLEKNEDIVLYNKDQLYKIVLNYDPVKNAFRRLGKSWRRSTFWTSTESSEYMRAWAVAFRDTTVKEDLQYSSQCVRPVIALKVE